MRLVSWFLLIVSLLLTLGLSFVSKETGLGWISAATALAFCIFSAGAAARHYPLLNVVGALPISLFLLFVLLQVVPLPPLIVEALSPHTFSLYQPLLLEQESYHWITLSTHPKRTLQLFFAISSSFLVYILAQQFFSDRIKIKLYILRAICVATLVTLLVTGLQFLTAGINLLAFNDIILFLLPLIFALYLYYVPVIHGPKTIGDELKLLIKEPEFQQHLLYLVSFLMLMGALIFQIRWAALFQLYLVAVIFLSFFTLKFTGSLRPLLILLILFLIPLAAWIFLSDTLQDDIWHYLARNNMLQAPGEQINSVVKSFQSFPLFGCGLGTYEGMFAHLLAHLDGVRVPTQQPLSVRLMLELGGLGIALLFWFFLSVFLAIWKMVRNRGDRFVSLMGIASLSALTAFLLQVLFFPKDFGIATLIFLAAFIGACMAAVHCRFNYYEPLSYFKEQGRSSVFMALGGSSVLVVFSLMFFTAGWYGSYLDRAVGWRGSGEDLTGLQQKADSSLLQAAMSFDPLESLYPHKIGQLEAFVGEEEAARKFLARAGIKSVMNGEVYQQLALIGQRSEEERLALVELGYQRDPGNTRLSLQYGNWLFASEKRKQAIQLAQKALALEPEKAQAWLPLLTRNEVTAEEFIQILPPSVALWLQLGVFSETEKNLELADFFHQHALTLTGLSYYVNPGWLQKIVAYFKRRGRDDMEVLALRRAISLLPEVAIFHQMLGDYYKRDGVRYRAIEEYQEALELDPDDHEVESELQELLETE